MSPSDLDTDIDPPGPLDPQNLWQAQKKELDAVTLAHIHTKAARFEKLIHRRNALEYLSVGVSIVVTGVVTLLIPHQNLVMRAGAAGIVLGLAFMGWQLHRRTSPEATPRFGESLADAYRRQLVRQRDAGVRSFWWYSFPIIPGPALMLLGVWLRGPVHGDAVRLYVSLGVGAVLLALGLAFSMYLIRAGVRGLQKMIDDLDSHR
jgi:hypothetical protein